MKFSRCLALAAVLCFGMNSAQSQEEFTHLSLGASAGKGYALDVSYGKLERSGEGNAHGGELVFSVWTPEFRFPITKDNTPLTNSDDYSNGAYIETSKENIIGFGIGTRYIIKPIAVGGMFDLIMLNRYDYYRNPNNNVLSHLRDDATLGGWTGTVSFYVNDRISANGFYGTRRGVNAGLAWTIINP